MRKLLIWAVLAVLAAGYWLIQRSPDTVAAQGAPSPLVVIDPGHGGWDPGAVRGAVYEKTLTLAVALKTGLLLQQRDRRVYYTRSRDTALSTTVIRDLNQRAGLANRLGATIFCSVHVNIESTGTMAGPIVYFTPTSGSSYRLAKSVSRALVPLAGQVRPPRPIRQWVLNVAQMPAINVEIGFLSHQQDTLNMQSAAHQRQLALGIAQGISQYLGR
ncbi:MAG: N-acetylmuramoyl-L-alanine amidase [Thermaerobacter sp.]|nr:N-acetylmuramoyl-L-alanine amidase [Thermaerobacter sp.]